MSHVGAVRCLRTLSNGGVALTYQELFGHRRSATCPGAAHRIVLRAAHLGHGVRRVSISEASTAAWWTALIERRWKREVKAELRENVLMDGLSWRLGSAPIPLR